MASRSAGNTGIGNEISAILDQLLRSGAICKEPVLEMNRSMLVKYSTKIMAHMERREMLLEDMREPLQPKEYFSIVVSSDTTERTTALSPPLYLDQKDALSWL